MHFFWFFFICLFHWISSCALRQWKQKFLVFTFSVPFTILYTLIMSAFWDKIFHFSQSLFLWELLSAFDHCFGSLPSLFSPTTFHFSVKVTDAACSILSKVMPLITIYMYLILLPDLFLMESRMLGFIFGCCWAGGSINFGGYTACLELLLCLVSYSSQCWISFVIALVIHVTEVTLKLLTNLPFPEYIFDSSRLWHLTILYLSLFLPLSLVWVNILKTTGLSIGPGSTLLLNFCHNKKPSI